MPEPTVPVAPVAPVADPNAPAPPVAPVAPAAPAAPAAPVPPVAPAPAANWLDGVANDDLKAWAITKGWKGPEAALQSTRHLESMMGAPAQELIRIPTGGVDIENGREIYAQLGMPKEATDYTFTMPEGMEPNTEMQDWARENFHKLGLSNTQADKLNGAFIDLQVSQAKMAEDSRASSIAAGDQNLQREWGDGYDNMVNQGKMAIDALGLSADVVNAIEDVVGYESIMKWAANIGSKLGEDTFSLGDPGGGSGESFHGMTPDRARQIYQSKLADKGWMESLNDKRHPNHKVVIKEKSDLYALMYPEG